ncbi:RNA polymerase recycling motor ATPase HelR [Aeromicrobium piscarium]|uniref:AAA family ATPase n=1 Tax=Aeromicrobium piscarium TaxID=2590901 RepID=A0A554SFQ9_9ACTN|nr:RNA polymerase recycling motor ATPase HelR [Aeromicrobium piscarium]TSD65185.1 AAA family ATPase [Aeromicrobium piscarium]
MSPSPDSSPVFALPDSRMAKAQTALIHADELRFAELATVIAERLRELTSRRDAALRAPAGPGQAALDRDQEVRRLDAEMRRLRRFAPEMCLGRMVPADAPDAPVYIGRMGLTAPDGRRLLIDWRSPAAEPFFAATPRRPMGLASRRRYRWSDGRVVDYWDEVLAGDGSEDLAPDEDSALLAALVRSRSSRMQEVLTTIQADQDAIIRASSAGALVVDGGPGTGKTVVALHRAAYLLYADPRLGEGRGGVLVIGPHRPYLAYIGDVLPSLGEDGVSTCTVGDLVPGLPDVPAEADEEVARLKARVAMVEAIEPAVQLYEEPPTESLVVETPWADLLLRPADWAEAFASADPQRPHNDARDEVWEAVLAILVDGRPEMEVSVEELVRVLRRDAGLAEAFDRAWPLIDPYDLVGDLWEVPAYLRRCAPWLTADEVRSLQRAEPRAWTASDRPLLDAARRRLGDPHAARRRRRHGAALAAEREERTRVIDDLIAADDSEMLVMSMLRGDDLRSVLDDEAPLEDQREPLDGPFAHLIVDEAQELSDAEWQMVLSRCPSRSVTIVGDRAQSRRGFTESWEERLRRVGIETIEQASLTVNYRTPAEVMEEAAPVIRRVLPDANVPISVRSSGLPVLHGHPDDLEHLLDDWLAAHAEGTACVIGGTAVDLRDPSRVRHLSPTLAKGLEFDLVVLLDPDSFGDGIEGAVDRYVAMTRATQRLVILHSR